MRGGVRILGALSDPEVAIGLRRRVSLAQDAGVFDIAEGERGEHQRDDEGAEPDEAPVAEQLQPFLGGDGAHDAPAALRRRSRGERGESEIAHAALAKRSR